MPKVGWGAVIRGEPTDLAAWAHVLKAFDPWVETHGTETVLRSISLDELESADEVRARAIGYIDRLNGAMAVTQHSRPVRFGSVIRFTPDGGLQRTAFPGTVKFEARGSVLADSIQIGPGGQPVPPPPPMPSDVQDWFKLADGDDRLADALVYFGRATERVDMSTDWFDIYKALECLILKFGGDRDLPQREERLMRGRVRRFLKLGWAEVKRLFKFRGYRDERGGVRRFLELGWAPYAEVKRLRWTANSARHATGKYDPHEKLMPPKEARELMERLLRRAFKEAANQPR
jgi:hypothetical protein